MKTKFASNLYFMKFFIKNNPYIAGILFPPFLYFIGFLITLSSLGIGAFELIFIVPIITLFIVTLFHTYVVLHIDRGKIVIVFFLISYVCFIILLYYFAYKGFITQVNFGVNGD